MPIDLLKSANFPGLHSIISACLFKSYEIIHKVSDHKSQAKFDLNKAFTILELYPLNFHLNYLWNLLSNIFDNYAQVKFEYSKFVVFCFNGSFHRPYFEIFYTMFLTTTFISSLVLAIMVPESCPCLL